MKEMEVDAVISNVETVTSFVDAELEAINCPMKAQFQIDVAIDELFGNIARYAYNPDVGKAIVRIEIENDPIAVILTFIDKGVPFNPIERMDPDITLATEEREIGGLGIFLVKKTMDELTYEYVDGKNILRVKKNL